MTEHINLSLELDPFSLKVLQEPGPQATTAYLDITSTPRLEPLLIGKDALVVPDLVKRLCGICPIPHHLAGVMALEAALGLEVNQYATLVRRLLATTATITTLSPRFSHTHREHTTGVRHVAKKAAAAAGCPGHFPDVAAPGGLTHQPDTPAQTYRDIAEEARALAQEWDTHVLSTLPNHDLLGTTKPVTGCVDVWLENTRGELDPIGNIVALRSVTGAVTRIPTTHWPHMVQETHPGSPAPRPRITLTPSQRNELGLRGDEPLYIRTGPVARHPEQTTSRRAQATAITHALATIADTCTELATTTPEPTQAHNTPIEGHGCGIVDSPRGLLVHDYTITKARLTSCAIHTPTAHNEWWLSQLLTQALATHPGNTSALEEAIRAADPCVPATDAAPGTMPITCHTIN